MENMQINKHAARWSNDNAPELILSRYAAKLRFETLLFYGL
jgi:hypothetical protein